MKTAWNRVTLMSYATEENNGEIPPMAPVWCALGAAVVWAVVLTAQWIVTAP